MEMKSLFLSFVVGLGIGVLYGLIRVKSPAPPIIALLGLLGMVLGEQVGIWIDTRTLDVPGVASICLAGERHNGQQSEAPGDHRNPIYFRADLGSSQLQEEMNVSQEDSR
jgi:XapX domain-containing protein